MRMVPTAIKFKYWDFKNKYRNNKKNNKTPNLFLIACRLKRCAKAQLRNCRS